MISNIDNQSLSMINYIDDAHDVICKLRDKIINTKPYDLIEDMNSFENDVKVLESKISLIISKVGVLRNLYSRVFGGFKDIRNHLSVKINEHKNNELPYNTSGTFYDESKLLKDIYVPSDSQIDPGINNVISDEIIDIKDYSCLAIINKFYGERNLLDELTELSQKAFISFEEAMTNYNRQLLELKELINDPETLMKLSEESDDASTTATQIKRLVNNYTYRIETARTEFIKLFNIYLDVKNNYEIYKAVIDSYTSVAYESLFNLDSIYELC